MTDGDCVRFLEWALPRARLRPRGFRRVRSQVCKRLERRRRELGLADLDAYRAHLEAHPDEWRVLDRLCTITISRLYRDRAVFAALEGEVLPALAGAAQARGGRSLAAWSAGCASGEEPYTLALIWELALAQRFPALSLRVLGTDVDPAVLARAARACYAASSLKELPARFREGGFVEREGLHCLVPRVRRLVTLAAHDVRAGRPDGPFHLVLCRNLVFTYFDLELQAATCGRLADAVLPGGALVVGAHEALPPGVEAFEPWPALRGVYRRRR